MSFRIPAAVILLTALAARLLHLWQMRQTVFFSVLMGDSRGYDAWAQQIAAGEWLGREVFYQAPLYPYILGVIYALFGHDLLIVRIVQVLIGGVSCVALGWATALLLSPRAGVLAGLMLALYPPAIFFDGLLQKSVLDVFVLCLALAALAAIVSGEGMAGRARWFVLGLAMGAFALTRENALLLTLAIGVWMLTQRSAAVSLAAFIVGVLTVLLPVVTRNAAVGGGFYLTTSQLGSNLYIGNNPRADGSYMSLREGRGSPEFERLDATELAEEGSGRQLTPGEVSTFWTRRTIEYVAAQPVDWLRLMARKTWLLVSSTEIIDTESQESHAEYSWVLALLSRVWHFGVLLPLGVIGAVMLWPLRRRLAPIYLLTAVYAASVVVFFVVARYRLPLAPLLMIVAAGGLLRIFDWWSQRMPARSSGLDKAARASEKRRVLGAVLAGSIVAVVANWPLHSAASQRAITENNLGTALQDAGRVEAAIAHYQRALALDADYAPAQINLGTALRAVGRSDQAVATYDQALANGADSATLHLNRGNALMAQGRIADAVAAFRAAQRRDPDAAHVNGALSRALYDLGTSQLEGGDVTSAIDTLREALTLNPTAAAHNNLGIALASSGRIQEAVAEWEAALRIDPAFLDARQNLERAQPRDR